MSDHSYSQVSWLLDRLITLGRVFVWPAFLWFFTKRQDVREHITHLLTRDWRVKVPGATIKITSPEAPRKLPSEERERLFKLPPKDKE